MAGALDAISPDIAELRVGNQCCYELGGHVTLYSLAAAQPYPSRGACNLHRWATPDCMREPSGMVEALGTYPVGLSLKDVGQTRGLQ